MRKLAEAREWWLVWKQCVFVWKPWEKSCLWLPIRDRIKREPEKLRQVMKVCTVVNRCLLKFFILLLWKILTFERSLSEGFLRVKFILSGKICLQRLAAPSVCVAVPPATVNSWQHLIGLSIFIEKYDVWCLTHGLMSEYWGNVFQRGKKESQLIN